MYTKNEAAIIWLDMFEFLTYKKQEAILALFDEPAEIFDNFSKKYDLMCGFLNEKTSTKCVMH